MRVVAVLVVLAALAAGVTSIAGSAAASHRAGRSTGQNAGFPSWSPDGKQIAFAYIPAPRRYRIVRTSNKPGGAVHTVVAARSYCCQQLQWAADGQILVVPGVSLKSVRVQTGKAKRLVLSGCVYLPTGPCQATGFILSPNRKYAAVVVEIDCGDPHTCSYALDLVKVARGQEPKVVATEEDSVPLAFSPDDRQLVFRSHLGLMAVRLAGGEPVPLAQSGLPGASLVPSDVTQVQWSPDGRWVTYIENDFSADDQRLEVVATTGTSAPRDLATCSIGDLRFSWSPTSRLVAYDCTDQKGGFMTVRPDGTHLVNLLKGRKLVYAGYAPQWSPDGSRLLFVAGAFPFAGHVWTVRPNGRDLTRRS